MPAAILKKPGCGTAGEKHVSMSPKTGIKGCLQKVKPPALKQPVTSCNLMDITNDNRNWMKLLEVCSDSSTWHQGPHGTTLQGDAMLWPYWCHQIPNHSSQPKKVPESMYQYTQHQVTSDNFSNILKTRHLLGDKFHAHVYIKNQFFDSKTLHKEKPLEQKWWMRSNHSVYEMVDLVWPHVTGVLLRAFFGCKSASKKQDGNHEPECSHV